MEKKDNPHHPVKDTKEPSLPLNKSNNKELFDLLSCLEDIIYKIEIKTTKTLFISPSLEKITNYKPEDILGQNFNTIQGFFHPEDIEKQQQIMTRFLFARKDLLPEDYVSEYRFKTKSGNYIWIRDHRHILYDDTGEAEFIIGVARDITESKKIYTDLIVKDRALSDSINAIALADTQGLLTYINQSFLKMWGYKEKEEVLGKMATIFWESQDKAMEVIQLLYQQGYWIGELIAKKKDESTFPVQLSASMVYDEYKKPLALLASFVDIAHVKNLIEQLKVKTRELENFVYTVSHDLKAPLVSIAGFASILQREYQDKLDEEGIHFLERIKINIVHMEKLIKNLLDLSRVGRILGEKKPIPMKQIVTDVIEDLKPQIEEKNIKLIIDEELPILWVDEERIKQVIANLVDNAVHFIGERSNPFIRIGVVAENIDGYQLYIQDNGIGIEERYFDKIFQIFERLEELSTDGTGLGLTIVKNIIENHGGRIWVESEKEKGSTFFFTIPKKQGEE